MHASGSSKVWAQQHSHQGTYQGAASVSLCLIALEICVVPTPIMVWQGAAPWRHSQNVPGCVQGLAAVGRFHGIGVAMAGQKASHSCCWFYTYNDTQLGLLLCSLGALSCRAVCSATNKWCKTGQFCGDAASPVPWQKICVSAVEKGSDLLPHPATGAPGLQFNCQPSICIEEAGARLGKGGLNFSHMAAAQKARGQFFSPL